MNCYYIGKVQIIFTESMHNVKNKLQKRIPSQQRSLNYVYLLSSFSTIKKPSQIHSPRTL